MRLEGTNHEGHEVHEERGKEGKKFSATLQRDGIRYKDENSPLIAT
ncbi:hypothetical protein [Nodularia sp. NIES-3585]|nr:hypothetical protein [Nodularia sp. NIES-3585]GAX34371.1 hypothetical protein NIES3585_03710 [Nodularia sp. NIES-3585]